MNFGDISLDDKLIKVTSVTEKKVLELQMGNAAQAVVPQSNRDDLEIQFNENDIDKESDNLLQITFHFPPAEVDEEGNVEELTPAQKFQTEIMNVGVIKSIKGSVICEFNKEMGNFVTPRGKYTMQMTSTYLHMQGQQYSYKIKYSDINALFLLDKPGDGLRMALVICLDKPIRQGNQKYQHLVLETHKMENTIKLNLTEEEIEANESYKGQLQPEMTMATASLIAKIFKVLSETTVFVPKAFKSFRNDFSVRCNVKTAEGLLYPLAKTMIFINKPTIVCKYDDIEYIEFQRVAQVANSATRNFDVVISLKKDHSGPANDTSYMFSSIDRTEYSGLYDFFEAKKISIMGDKETGMDRAQKKQAGMFQGMEGDAGDDEDEEEDDDYEAGKSDHSADSDDSGSESGASESGDEKAEKPAKEKKREKKPSGEKKRKAAGDSKEKGGKKAKKAKKDPNAPKKPMTAYFLFLNENRAKIQADIPGIKFTEITKEGSVRWKAASEEVKKEFEDKAKADKERYSAEMKTYQAKQAASGADLDLDSDDDL